MRSRGLAALAIAGILALSGCGGGSKGASSGSSGSSGSSSPSASAGSGGGGSSAGSKTKVGLAYDIGGRGDKSFNDSAAAGLDRAKQQLGIKAKDVSISADNEQERESKLRLLAQGGYDPVIAVGFLYADSVKKVASEFPKTTFAIVDDSSFTAPNVVSLVFAEQQGSYLVGAAAALASKTHHVGYIGGVQTPLLQKFEAGYVAGAKKIDPSIQVDIKYLTQPPDFSGFAAPDKGKAAAQGMLDHGADVVYAAAGGSGKGAFEAVKAKPGTWAIGVDSDQYQLVGDQLKGIILTSMLKRVDVAVFNEIKDFIAGDTKGGVKRFDLAKDGVGYSKSNPAIDPYVSKIDALKQQIVAGQITVPETPSGS